MLVYDVRGARTLIANIRGVQPLAPIILPSPGSRELGGGRPRPAPRYGLQRPAGRCTAPRHDRGTVPGGPERLAQPDSSTGQAPELAVRLEPYLDQFHERQVCSDEDHEQKPEGRRKRYEPEDTAERADGDGNRRGEGHRDGQEQRSAGMAPAPGPPRSCSACCRKFELVSIRMYLRVLANGRRPSITPWPIAARLGSSRMMSAAARAHRSRCRR